MCKIEENIYTSADGARSTTKEPSYCDKAQPPQVCPLVVTMTTHYYHPDYIPDSYKGTAEAHGRSRNRRIHDTRYVGPDVVIDTDYAAPVAGQQRLAGKAD